MLTKMKRSMKAQPITVALIDHSAGFEGTPERVPLERHIRGESNARLVEFGEHAPSVDEDELARLTRRGTNAWKDVPDATAWVDELRGDTH